MKKIIALALALTLALSLATVAFAADEPIDTNTYAPGSKIALAADKFTQTTTGDAVTLKDLTKDNYTVYTSFSKGSALVDTVKFDKEDGLVLVLKENYTIDEAKAIEGTITLKARSADRTAYEYKINSAAPLYVSNKTTEVQGTRKADDAEEYSANEDNTIYICEEGEAGYVKFNSESDLLSVTLKMSSEERAFMFLNEDMISDLSDRYSDADDADIYCYTFEGSPALKNAATVSLQADYGTQYNVYEWAGGKLRAVDAKFNKEDGVYEWSTKRLTSYVISDVKLKVDAAADDTEEETEEKDNTNPDTGANDIVGVAAALAVVSLIAAGAVSLKK